MATVTRLLRVAAPMGAVTMLISLNANIPRYFVEHARGASELGIFAALAYLTMAGSTMINALGQSAVPRLSAMHATGDLSGFQGLLCRMVGLGALLGIGGVGAFALFGRPLLTLMYRPEFGAQRSLVIWVMAAGAVAFVASPFGYAMTSARHFVVQLPLFIGVTVMTTLAGAVLIPAYGLMGGAWTLLVSGTTQLVGSAGVVAWIVRRPRVPEMEVAEVAG
jgi:O-antigen/teichoic acid export membrane protein